MPEFEIRVGHTLDLLRATLAETYHCIVMSPPYFGLRAYEGVEPSVWGGVPECAHEFFSLGTRAPKPDRDTSGKGANGSGVFGEERGSQPSKAARGALIWFGEYCQFCNAWRGVLGSEPTVEMFVGHMVEVCREVWRVLRSDGTLWLNLGDSYNSAKGVAQGSDPKCAARRFGLRPQDKGVEGFKPKDLMLVPHRVAIALQADGWWVRMDNVWSKKNCLPESVEDRPTKSHEYVFLLTKSDTYYYDAEAVRERQTGNTHSRGRGVTPKTPAGHDPMIRYDESWAKTTSQWHEAPDGKRNLRSVWEMASEPYREAHFATFPSRLPTVCIKAGTSEAGVCPTCAAPWERIVRAEGGAIGKAWSDHSEDELVVGHKQRNLMAKPAHAKRNGNEYVRETIGWRMTCGCPYQTPAPALVLDPFSGAGTTGLAALRLGRSYVGHEASPQYAEMSRKRICGESPMFFQEVRRDEKQPGAELSCQAGR